jgi:hypothetical protein
MYIQSKIKVSFLWNETTSRLSGRTTYHHRARRTDDELCLLGKKVKERVFI